MTKENKKCGDRWTVEVLGERHNNSLLHEWGPLGPITRSLEEATDWLITCSKLNTKTMFQSPSTGNWIECTLQFRLHNLTTDEIIPMELLIA